MVRKSFDLASPRILTAAATHETLQQGVLTVIDAQGADFLVMTLKQILVESVTITDDAQLPPPENLAMRFDEIEVNYKGEDVIVRRSTTARRKAGRRRRN